MTVSVRSWPQMAAVLRYDDGISTPTFGDLYEAAVAGDTLAAVVAAVHAALPDCQRCGGTQRISVDIDCDFHGPDTRCNNCRDCPDCDHGKVSVAQLAATYARVWEFPVEERHQHGGEYGEGWRACIDHLRAVKP